MTEKLKLAQKRRKELEDSESENKWRDDAIKNIKYISGEDQGWDDKGDRARLEADNRPAFTLNKIHPIFRLICGAMPEIETKYNAVEEGDVETADIFNECKAHVDEINMWEFYNKEWFKYAISLNRSVVEIKPDFSEDPRGEIKLELRDGFEFLLGPSKKKDRSDMEYMFERFSVSQLQAKRLFPDKYEQIKELLTDVEHSEGNKSHDSGLPDEYNDPKADYYDKGTKKIKIYRYWYKEYTSEINVIDNMSGDVFTSNKKYNEVKDEIAGFGQEAVERFAILPKDFTSVKYLTFIHDITLEEDVTAWEREDGQPTKLSQNFPFIIFEPDRFIAGTREDLISLINPMKDPQMYYNKLASAVVEIIGSAAKVGVDYEDGALDDKKQEDKLLKYGAKIGAAIKWAKGAISGNKFKFRTGTANPQAELLAAREMAGALLDISGVESLISTESLGKGASGEAIREKKTQGANVISWVYEAHRFFCHILAQFLRDAMQVMYDYPKVIRIRGSNPRYVTINDQVYDETGAVTQVMNDITTGRYDTKISDKPIEPSARIQRFVAFSEMVKSKVLPLPREVLIKVMTILMDDPELKQVIEEGMNEYQQTMAQLPPEQMAAA